MNDFSGFEAKERVVREKKIDATLRDYIELLAETGAACLRSTHEVPGVFKLKVTFELLDSESTDRG